MPKVTLKKLKLFYKGVVLMGKNPEISADQLLLLTKKEFPRIGNL